MAKLLARGVYFGRGTDVTGKAIIDDVGVRCWTFQLRSF